MLRPINHDAPIPIARAPRAVLIQIANSGSMAAGWGVHDCDGCPTCYKDARDALAPLHPDDANTYQWPAYRRAARWAARKLGVEVL